ncbi:hypothetical protein ACFXOS_24055 [Streptomyces sp. NPDC059175]|uniref:hypothetical protein n=1 Tax=Streptomyces sp. NPDC059175 TaxID=3346757 RepID=UPI00367BBD08
MARPSRPGGRDAYDAAARGEDDHRLGAGDGGAVAELGVGRKEDYRLPAVVDGPSRAVPDRVLQRTGPMSKSEKQGCTAARPMTSTPVGADAPAGSADKGLPEIPPPTAPGGRALRTIPLP